MSDKFTLEEVKSFVSDGRVLYGEWKSDVANFQAIFDEVGWRYAKTMPKNPHWYTLRDNWLSPAKFYACVFFIRLHGTVDWWPDVETGRAYVALDFNGYHYWTMGDPMTRTWLINRKPLVLDQESLELEKAKYPSTKSRSKVT